MIASASSSSLPYAAAGNGGGGSSTIIIYSAAAPPSPHTSLSLNPPPALRPSFFRLSPLHSSNHPFLPIQDSSAAAAAADVLLSSHDKTPTPIPQNWTEFGDRVSGEWDGFGADFTPQGTPIELPESVVPEAYREWEVKVHDWQTQCPTIARPEPASLLSYTTVKLLPTVGCEADAATRHTSQPRVVLAQSSSSSDSDSDGKVSSASALAYHSSGSYVAVWPATPLELEHCLVNPQDRESRVRILLALTTNNDSSSMSVLGIRVFREQWYGPFRNGDQLGGCAIRDSAFAATPPLHPSKLLGLPWRRTSTAVAVFDHQTGSIQQLNDDNSSSSSSSLDKECVVRDESGGLVLLPKQLWCSVKDGWCEAGWIFDDAKAVTSTAIFAPDATMLKQVRIAYETAEM